MDLQQSPLEDEAYITISFIPFIIYGIRKGLENAINVASSSETDNTNVLEVDPLGKRFEIDIWNATYW